MSRAFYLHTVEGQQMWTTWQPAGVNSILMTKTTNTSVVLVCMQCFDTRLSLSTRYRCGSIKVSYWEEWRSGTVEEASRVHLYPRMQRGWNICPGAYRSHCVKCTHSIFTSLSGLAAKKHLTMEFFTCQLPKPIPDLIQRHLSLCHSPINLRLVEKLKQQWLYAQSRPFHLLKLISPL